MINMTLQPNAFYYDFRQRLFLSNREPSRWPDDGTCNAAILLCGIIAGLDWQKYGDRSLIFKCLN